MNPARRTPQILVVDDDTTTNLMLQGMLRRAGFQPTAVFDAAQAFSHLRDAAPDLVLLDINLPDGNGLDVCRKIRAMPGTGSVPVLFISSADDVTTKVRGFEAGGVDYIAKPLAGEEVIARVSTHLRLKQAYESLAELQAERIRRLTQAQEILMPRPEDLPDTRFSVAMRQVLAAGGDFYDVIPVGRQMVDYVVADASGHDLAAAFWTAALKALLTEYATSINTPRDVVHSVNNAIRRLLPSGVFFTLIYARLNRQTGRLGLVNAGHPSAVVVRQSEEEAGFAQQDGDVLGAFPDASFGTAELQLRRGDRFFLYSDGLIEWCGDRDRGMIRLVEACRAGRTENLEQHVNTVFQRTSPEGATQDDTLVMGVEV